MKILLINPPGWQKGSTNLGLCYLAGNLIANGHEVKIFDVNATDESPEIVAEKARQYAPEVIGFSIKTATAKAAFLISKTIKKSYGDAIHVIGGTHVTIACKEVLQENPEIEYAFLGEADLSFIDFVNKLKNHQPVNEVAGIAFRAGDDITVTNRKYIEDLDSLPYPNFQAIENFNFDDFRYPMITSRGCPYLCTYCCVGIVSSKKWRARKPDNIVEELKYVKERFGIKMFEILDDNFTLKIERAKEFCRLFIASKLRLTWYCHNGIRADKIDLELAKLMKKAGCTSVAIGMESGDEKIFDSIKKGEKLEDIVNAVRLIKKAGMRTVGYFIIGLPGDSLEGIKKTIQFQQGLGLDDFTYGILNPYPYTEVYDIIKRDGTILMDIKDSSHFSSDLIIPFEMPGFSKEDMKNAYNLSKFQGILQIWDAYKEKYGEKPAKVFYVDFFSASRFAEYLTTLQDGYELDVLIFSGHEDSYLQNKASLNIMNLYIYNDPLHKFEKIMKFLKMFMELRKRDYSIIFFNAEKTRKIIVPALLLMFLMVRYKMFFFVRMDGTRFLSLSDKKIWKYAGGKILKLPGLILSLIAIPFFRIMAIGFGLLLYFKRSGQTVEFTSHGPEFTNMKGKEK